MVDYLDKTQTLFERDNDGKLLPVEAEIEINGKKSKIKCVPLTKADFAKIKKRIQENESSEEEADKDIIINNCVLPKYTAEEVEVMKLTYAQAIAAAIVSVSTGISQEEIVEKGKERTVTEADNFLQ